MTQCAKIIVGFMANVGNVFSNVYKRFFVFFPRFLTFFNVFFLILSERSLHLGVTWQIIQLQTLNDFPNLCFLVCLSYLDYNFAAAWAVLLHVKLTCRSVNGQYPPVKIPPSERHASAKSWKTMFQLMFIFIPTIGGNFVRGDFVLDSSLGVLVFPGYVQVNGSSFLVPFIFRFCVFSAPICY